MENRCYHQYCGLARCLDRVGERWTLLIVRDMLLGPRRYSQLLESLKGITTNLLAKRLKDMQAWGLIEKLGSGPSTRYRLTPDGAALEPALMELARWGGRFMGQMDPEDRRDLGWALISCKRRYIGGQAGLRAGIEADGRHFELAYDAEKLVVQEREAISPDIFLKGSEEEIFMFLMRSTLAPGLRVEQREPTALGRLSQALQLHL